jgi:hypothetical protein
VDSVPSQKSPPGITRVASDSLLAMALSELRRSSIMGVATSVFCYDGIPLKCEENCCSKAGFNASCDISRNDGREKEFCFNGISIACDGNDCEEASQNDCLRQCPRTSSATQSPPVSSADPTLSEPSKPQDPPESFEKSDLIPPPRGWCQGNEPLTCKGFCCQGHPLLGMCVFTLKGNLVDKDYCMTGRVWWRCRNGKCETGPQASIAGHCAEQNCKRV